MFDHHFKDVEKEILIAFNTQRNRQELQIDKSTLNHCCHETARTYGENIHILLQDFSEEAGICIQEAYCILYKQVAAHLLPQMNLSWSNLPKNTTKMTWLKDLKLAKYVSVLAHLLFDDMAYGQQAIKQPAASII